MRQMPHDFEAVYDVLDAARNRPGMYGIGGRSFRLLQAFLSGLNWGKLAPGDPSVWDFPFWVTVRKDVVGTSFPWHWLETSETDEEAYGTWFRLLDEYRGCREVELARLPGSI